MLIRHRELLLYLFFPLLCIALGDTPVLLEGSTYGRGATQF
ncbi:hypothetical protein PF003_g35858 [Phytophthora fragariae]|nr:hypothetical protein PF003_g35858 [Phytophthora fragariae]